ncbi:MAG: hypothetical protein ACREMY_05190, partial [bacterium]
INQLPLSSWWRCLDQWTWHLNFRLCSQGKRICRYLLPFSRPTWTRHWSEEGIVSTGSLL